MFLAQNNGNWNVIHKFEGVIVGVIELKWCNWFNSVIEHAIEQPCRHTISVSSG